MISLRFAELSDAPALLEIYRPYVEETTVSFETEVPSLEEFQRRILEYSQDFPYLTAWDDGEIVGYAYAHPFHERAAFHWTVETSIYVRRDCRHRQVGTRLYRALLTLLQAQGVKNAIAVVTIPNDPSMVFHQALGFSPGPVLPQAGYKKETWCGVAYLYRALDSKREGPPSPLIPVDDLDRDLCRKLLT